MCSLADLFPNAKEPLENLLGSDGYRKQLPRLEEIFKFTELAWEHNIKRLQGKTIKYLLIAEAAPWTATGIPRYFYGSLKGPWVARILKTFFEKRPNTDEEAWAMLANRGFLLVDTLPFALNYTRIRNGPDYLKLLRESKDHFLKKLNHPNLCWAPDMKIAFAFKLNGSKVIDIYDKITLPNRCEIKLNEEMISADRSGYTNTQLLCNIWEID